MVGGADDALLVLDHHDRVAAVAEAEEGLRERLVVARVEADRRLVEDVADAAQVGGERRHDADALRLAGRERVGPALEREVAEAEAGEQIEAQRQLGPDALAHLLGQLALERRRARRGPRRTVSAATSPMWRPAILTARASGRRRVPAAGTAGDPFGAARLAVLLDPRRAEAVALGTGPVLLAPREQPRVGGGEARAAARAGAAGRVEALGAAGQGRRRCRCPAPAPARSPLPAPERRGRARRPRFGEAAVLATAGDHRLDVVDLEPVDPRRLRRVVERPVDAHLGDALLRGGGDRVEVEALASPDERREEGQLAGREVLGHARGESGRVHHLARPGRTSGSGPCRAATRGGAGGGRPRSRCRPSRAACRARASARGRRWAARPRGGPPRAGPAAG